MSDLLQYFDELCDLPLPAREARLLAIAEFDATLAEKLRTMLKADAQSTDLIARDIAAQPQLGAELWRTTAPADFAAFHILRELGAGGMGVVYLAQRQLGASTQQVALKFVRHTGNAELLKHFERERDALARLEHPNIARLIDAGVSPEGVPYIATEYVDGTQILDYAGAQKLDIAGRLRLIENLCDAVDYAHRRLLVHRDIKPSNVIVDDAGRVKLLDFGIAKALDAGAATRTHNNPMSPAYAAPEQALGEPVSTATDVFGLGLLLFELLTGQLPPQRRALSASDMAHKIGTETIDAPSRSCDAVATSDAIVSAPDWPKRLRGDLDLIVLKALKREPERRYASALALAEDLRRFREGHAIAARPDSTWYRVRKLVGRNRVLVGAAVVMLLTLLGGFGVALWQADIARRQAVRADAEAQRATLQATRAQSVKDFVLALFKEQNPLTRDKARAASAGELIERGITTAQNQFANDIATQADIVGELAELQLGLGDVKQSVPNLQAALALHARAHGKASVAYATTLTALGSAWLTQGETAKATEAIASALVTLRQLTGDDSLAVANAQRQQLRLLLLDGQLAKALPLAQHVYKVYQREHGAKHAQTLQALYDIGGVFSQLDRLKEAEQTYRQVIDAYNGAELGDHAALVYPRLALARTLKDQQQYAQAATQFDSTLATATDALDAGHPLIGRILLHQGDLLRRMRRYQAAEQVWQRAEQIFAKQNMQAELGAIGIYRGALAMELQQFAPAVEHYKNALAHYQAAMGPDNTFCYSAALRLAQARAAAGQTALALQEGRAAHEAMKAIAEPGTFDQTHAHAAWAEVLFVAQQWRESEAQYRQALALDIANNGSDTIDVAVSAWQIAETLYAQNRADAEAITLLDQAVKIMRQTDSSDSSLGEALLLRGKLLDRKGQREAAVNDWRAAYTNLLAAFGAQDRRVVALKQLLAQTYK
jgi:eukaryotic-like serine/threonine-protein kinase